MASTKALSTPAILISLEIDAFESQGWDDRIAQKTECFRKESLVEFFDLDQLLGWLAQLDHGKLDAEDGTVSDLLRALGVPAFLRVRAGLSSRFH